MSESGQWTIYADQINGIDYGFCEKLLRGIPGARYSTSRSIVHDLELDRFLTFI